MEAYLAKCSKKNFEGEFTSTPTRIEDKSLNIYGGSYCIQQNLEEVWNKYYKFVV